MSFFKKLLKTVAPVAGFALGGPLGGIAGGLLGGMIHGGKKGGSSGPSPLDAAAQHEGSLADQEESDYLTRARGFDASQSLNNYAQGAAAAAQPQLLRNLASLQGQSVGAGRFDSGLFDEDSGQIVGDAQANLNANIASHALDAAGLQQQNTAQLGSFAQGARTNYLDLLSGNADRDQAAKNAKSQGKASVWGSLLGAGGAIAGGFLGGRK